MKRKKYNHCTAKKNTQAIGGERVTTTHRVEGNQPKINKKQPYTVCFGSCERMRNSPTVIVHTKLNWWLAIFVCCCFSCCCCCSVREFLCIYIRKWPYTFCICATSERWQLPEQFLSIQWIILAYLFLAPVVVCLARVLPKHSSLSQKPTRLTQLRQ